MSTYIYLIRHAEAEGNLFRVAHGQYDSTITARGYRQLSHLRERFRDVRLDAVYGSDLLRARATASALYIPKGLPFRPEPRLREVNLGSWERRTWADIQREDLTSYVQFNKRPDLWHIPGGEDLVLVRERALAALRDIAAAHPGGTVAAAGHGAALRTLLGALQGLSLEETGATPYGDNTAVSLIEAGGGEFRVVYRDDVSHVPPETSTFRRQTWHKSDTATEPGLWFRVLEDTPEGQRLQAMLEDDPAGETAYRLEKDGLRITDYALEPACRGQRYGIQMLGQAVQYARDHGRNSILIQPGPAAAGYFRKYGFTGRGETLSLDISPVIRDIP